MADPVRGQVISIENYSKKTGIGKNGKEWNIMTVTVRTVNGKDVVADTFDKVEVGADVVVEFDAQYNSSKAKLYRSNPQQEKLDEMYNLIKDIHKIVCGDISTATPDEKTVQDLEKSGW